MKQFSSQPAANRYPTDLSFAAETVTGLNLNRLDADTAGALEARRAHLRELALALAADRPTVEVLLDRLAHFRAALPYTPDCLDANADFLRAGFAQLSLLERVELCRLICREPGEFYRPTDLLEPDEPLPAEAKGIIAYLQNAFTDRAYRAFSAALPRARSQYHDSYGAACEAVSNGSCEACILPIEHAQDGKLLGFYRLIDRYELKIVCTCDIAQPGGTESRFALLKKGLKHTPPPADGVLGWFFEFSITRSAGKPVGSILDAAQWLGLELRRVDSLPLAYAEDSFAYHAVLALPDAASLTSFLLYLALELPQYNPIGIYSHIIE